MNLPDIIKLPLKALQRECIRAGAYFRSVDVPTSGFHVFCGDVLSNEGSIVRGGAVKLLPLVKAFPGSAERFNIFYMVSSVWSPAHYGWMACARRRGAKVVLNQNGVGWPGWAGEKYKQINALNRYMIDGADFIIYQSNYSHESVKRWVVDSKTPSCTIPNCVDTNAFSPPSKLLPLDPFIVLAAGSHEQPYRVKSLLETIKLVRNNGVDCRLLLAGRIPWDDANPGSVERMAVDTGLAGAIKRLPPYKREQAPGIFRQGHLLLHPTYKDACPTVVLEAMATGLPVVATRSGGTSELVDAGSGVLIEVQDTWETLLTPNPELAAEAVLHIRQEYHKYSDSARKRAEIAFSEKGWINEHISVFSRVLESQ